MNTYFFIYHVVSFIEPCFWSKLTCVQEDSNASIEDFFMKSFCENYDVRSLVKEPKCFENPENPYCIDPSYLIIIR